MVGPTIQQDLFAIMTRFRTHRYAFIADIEKMYRQILVSPRDSNLQRIVWRDSPHKELKHYALRTVTYGTASASFLATRCLKQISQENSTQSVSYTHLDVYKRQPLYRGAQQQHQERDNL